MDTNAAAAPTRPGVMSLRPPALSTAAVALGNGLYRRAAASQFDGWSRRCQWKWRPQTLRGPLCCAQLRGTRVHATVILLHELDTALSDAPPWHDLQGELRLLAWAMRYEPLLRQLSNWAGDALAPDNVYVGNPPSGVGEYVLLGFQIEATTSADASVEPASPRATQLVAAGALWWPAAQRLDCVTDAAPAWGQVDPLHVSIALSLPALQLPADSVAALAPGDILILPLRQSADQPLALPLCLAGRNFMSVVQRDRHWALRDVAAQSSFEENAMDGLSSAEASSPLESLPLTLNFDVGDLAMTVGELRTLAPGHVFELPARLDRAPVRVRINGKEFARGELVAIGDALGVRLTSLTGNGLR